MPSVLRWLLGLATSLTGTHIYLVTLAWVAVQTTTPANVGWILVASAVPQAVLLLLGGVLVDRIGPKRTIIASDALRVLVMVVFAAVLADGAVSPLLLAGLAVVFGVVDGFFLPAVSSAPRYLSSGAAMTRLVAAKTLVARGAEFAGAPLGSWLLLVASASVAFSVNASLFAVSVALLATVSMRVDNDAPMASRRDGSSPAMARPSVWADLAAGLGLVRGQRTLATLLGVVFVAELGFGGPMMAGVPLLANETGWGVAAIGWVLGGFGLGAAAVAGYLAWRRDVRRTGLVAAAGLATMGLSVVGLGVLPFVGLPAAGAVVVGGALGLLAGIGSGFFGTLVTTAVLHQAPSGQVGVVMAALSFSSLAAIPITYGLTGLVTGWSTAQLPFLVGGALVLMATVLLGTNSATRRLTTEPADPGQGVAGVAGEQATTPS